MTHGGLYPDTLDWSRGGEAKFGLQALIACNKKHREYRISEIIGVRSGIRNVSDSTIQLGFAYYSPNKHGIPPDYTLSIEGPYNYPRVIGYLGDDAIYDGPRTKLENMVPILSGKVFNPSPDSLFYNASDGLFSFEMPGTYRLWFTYSFDSLSSSLSVPLTSISSDTIELKVIAPRFVDAKRLLKFLPRKIDGFKGGKPQVHNRLINPHWTKSLLYPMVWRHYFREIDNFDAPYIGVYIVDSGFLPAVLNRHSLCKQIESSDTTVKGYPACKLTRNFGQENLLMAQITITIAEKIVVSIEGFRVQMKEVEDVANVIDYTAIEKSIK